MGDFFLDFRAPELRRAAVARAAVSLQMCPETRIRTIEHELFSIVLARVDGFDLWGPAEYRGDSENLFVALAGRIALDESGWESARLSPAGGGVACRAILDLYRRDGVAGLRALNGNFVAFIHDAGTRRFHLITDRCGMFLAYFRAPLPIARAFASHPDILADILAEGHDLDHTSIAEFLTTGRLTFPYTYYKTIRGLDTGTIHTIPLEQGADSPTVSHRYFQFAFKPERSALAADLATELAGAFRNAVRRRTLPLFGLTGIGLSGGLDSRAILSSVRDPGAVLAFTLFDEENEEYRAASALAAAARVSFVPIRRDEEYYANSAQPGVRVSGGTGSIASNHFLGVRKQLGELGIQNLLTGCYCDYLFKGLSLNTTESACLRVERLSPFKFAFYHACYWDSTSHRSAVEARLSERFPEYAQASLSDDDWLNIERKRAFPLAYEGDSAQRLIPQRVMPWYVPIVDNELVDVYLRIPSRLKLNARLFKQMVVSLCDPAVARIPDSNTGASLTSTGLAFAFHRYRSALKNRLAERVKPRMATRGSWPNWGYYLAHSRMLSELWQRPNEAASEVFSHILPRNPGPQLGSLSHEWGPDFSWRLLTLKLWLDQRAGNRPFMPV